MFLPTWQPTSAGVMQRAPDKTTPAANLEAIPPAATVVVAVPVLVPTAPPAHLGPDVVIAGIMYDGAVPDVESDEYVTIVNQGTAPVDLTGWTLDAGAGVLFRFPAGAIITPAQALSIYTNEIHPESGGLSFGSADAVWSNRGDVGILRNAAGAEVSRYIYP